MRTEQQKLEPSPLSVLQVDELFSPTCRCAKTHAAISLELRRRSNVTLDVVDDDGRVVRSLLADTRPRGGRIAVEWDGRDDAGQLVPDGVYRLRLRVVAERRTFLLTNRIRVDTEPPRATIVEVSPRVLTPNGDGRRDRVSIRYRLSERAQPLVYINWRLRLAGYSRRPEGKLDWYGKVRGKRVRRGRYRIQAAARDDAGNLGPLSAPVIVRVR